MTTAIEYVLMSGASYITSRPDINKFSIPQGWTPFFPVPDPTTALAFPVTAGFEAISFTQGTNIVISFAGTYDNPNNPLTNPDMQADISLATGFGSAQLLQAAEYYLQVKAANPSANITLTGHSLGGGLAALIGVFFGVSATTFDQAPFANSAELNLLTPDVAAILKTELLAKGYNEADLSGLTDFLYWRGINGGIPNSGLVTDISVEGQLLAGLPYSIFNTIGTEQQPPLPSSHAGVAGGDLHSQALLTAFLKSNVTAVTNAGQKQSLSQVTYKLPDLLKMIFDTNLFAHPTDDPKNENFIDRLVRHEFGNAPSGIVGVSSITADAMLARFTQDLWKLAQDGGMTMRESAIYSNWNNVSKALTAFAMQFYYEDTANAINPAKQLFTDLTTAGTGSNGIQFDMANVSTKFQTAFDNNQKLNLTDAKGYGLYFKNYIDTTGNFTPTEQQFIHSLLPYMRDWYVQAGELGLTMTHAANDANYKNIFERRAA